MTPTDIEVLLHYHCTVEAHPRRSAPAVQAAIYLFIQAGILMPNAAGTCYTTTLKGQALVHMLCQTPMPVQRFIDPRLVKENENEQ